ncbi:MAG TPA: ABC-F family ATP-binding cassette domain-containing protein [Gaiellaceae bacterium]|nr:ABC-F family ATP-binding cassette domain-containing protein [Gaiellaceae bacterium]
MAVVIASNLRKELAGTVLFDGVSFSVERRDRVALSGPNGAGKTTLLRILAGETEKHGGELAFAKGTRVALHDQRPPLEQELTLREYVLSGARDLVALEDELRRLEQAMTEGDHAQATLNRYAEAQSRLEHAGGYDWRDRATSVLRGLGFADDDLDRALRTFSGGELTRASLARALGGDPDLLLLDEPTNHLDVANLEWLERELASLDAAVILVAHDRWFLEAVTTATLELEAGRSTFFPGPWHAWRREKAARMLHSQKEVARVQADIARLERFVERFRYKKDKAKQAQAKLTQIGRLEQEKSAHADQIALLSRRSRGLGFEFLKPARSGRTVVEADGLDVTIPSDTVLLSRISFALERGEHVALVGPNGSGKTTLLEKLVRGDTGVGSTEPAKSEGAGSAGAGAGRIRIGHGVEVGYFSQQEMELDTRGTVLQCVQSMTGLPRQDAQNLLGRFLFSGWDAHEKPVTVLSGGERRRLALAVTVASGANFLVLDEPTNHLDLESREALEAALDAFPGTVLLVSHDRALLDAIAERTLAIEDGELRSYDGGWADLVRRREERAEREKAKLESRAVEKPKPAPKPKSAAAKKPRPSELERIEAEIAEREAEVTELERKLAEDWTDVDVLAAHKRSRDALTALLERWEQLFDQAQA